MRERPIKKTASMALMLLIYLCNAVGTHAHWEFHDLEGRYLFGYGSVGENPELYMPEVEANRIPTNAQSLHVGTPLDEVGSRLAFLRSRGQKAVILLDKLLFRNDSNLSTPCGSDAVRPWFNYGTRFDDWLRRNSAYVTPEHVAALVIDSEVNNRCIQTNSLDQVTQYVNARVPGIPTVAGYGQSTGAKPLPDTIPASLSGVLFYKYQVLDPRTDPEYQAAFSLLKSKLTPAQRIILVPDGFYGASHSAAGWPKWYLGYLALNYAEMAKADPTVVGLMFFVWPSFTDGSGTLGMRDLPQNVRDRHRLAACGLGITGSAAGFCD